MMDNLATMTKEAEAKIAELSVLRGKVARKYYRFINSKYYQNMLYQAEIDPEGLNVDNYREALDQKGDLKEQLDNYDLAILELNGENEEAD